MRRIIVSAVLGLLLWGAVPQVATAGVELGLSLSDGQNSFYLSIAERYQVSQERVVLVKKQTVPDEELPVLFFIAHRASVDPDMLVKLRLGGMSWLEIGRKCSVGPADYYVDLPNDPAPPYGRAHGYFKNKNRKEWHTIELSDREIVDFVNLKFMSEHYGYSPSEIIKMRASGGSFVDINAKIKKNKKGPKKSPATAQNSTKEEKSKKKGAAKGKGK